MIPIAIAVVLAALLVAREMSARRRARALRREIDELREHARQSERLANVGQLVSGLAQDLKSPLQGMLGSAELLAASSSPDPGAAQELREIRDNVTRAAGIVRNLLAFTETHALDRRWHDLNDIVRRGIEHRRADTEEAQQVQFEGAQRLPLVYVDGRQLERVVATLLDHAGSASSPRTGGRVAVSTARGGAADEKLMIDIDDPALRLTADEAAWAGDLDACRRVLEAHGGSLEVEQGTADRLRFHLELPVTALVESPTS